MVGVNWARNLAGKNMDEKGMANIPHPTAELTIHVTTKTVQLGGFFGTLLVGPLAAAVKGQRNIEGVKQWADHCGRYGALIGLAAGPFMTYRVASKASSDAIYDRSYRLRYNQHQLRVDRMFLVGATAGYAVATFLGESSTLGALLGMNGGMILAAILNTMS